MFNFPWSNFHELNLDWILSVVKEAKEVFDTGRSDIDYAVETADEAKEIATQAAEATIADNSVSTSKIQDGAVTHSKLANNSVTTDNIVDRTIIGNDIAENTIESYNIKNGTIIGADIAQNTITYDNLASGSVVNSKISDNAVTTPKIADGAVTTAKLPSAGALRDFLQVKFLSSISSVSFDGDDTTQRLTIYVDTADYGWRLWFTPSTGLFQGKAHSETSWTTLHTIY